jgi:hypothetical protein
LILSLVAVDVFGQQEMTSFKFDATPDSIISKQQRGYIYITRDTSAEMFDRLASDINVKENDDLLREYARHIKKEFGSGIVIKNLGDLPRKWNSVYVLNNEYYVYSPSDWINNRGYYVSDSAIIVTNSEPDLFVILDYKRINKKLYEFRIVDYAGEKHHVQITLVDAAYRIYVWTFTNKGELSRYLMQDSRFVKGLPMIVADCGDKCILEFEFDKPDFEKILHKANNPLK